MKTFKIDEYGFMYIFDFEKMLVKICAQDFSYYEYEREIVMSERNRIGINFLDGIRFFLDEDQAKVDKAFKLYVDSVAEKFLLGEG